MARVGRTPAEDLLLQSRGTLDWLRTVPSERFGKWSVLPRWDIRQLVGHLVLIHTGFATLLDQPTRERPLAVADFVTRYQRDVEMIMAATVQAADDHAPGELLDQLSVAIEKLDHRLSLAASLPSVIMTPRGPTSVADFTATRIVELLVHSDDLHRSLPDLDGPVLARGPMGRGIRTLTAILAERHPGGSVEVRIPPHAAVQCAIRLGPDDGAGPTHTRGTPPNVVETDPLTFLRLATGRTSWHDALQSGTIHASGARADLSAALPLLQ